MAWLWSWVPRPAERLAPPCPSHTTGSESSRGTHAPPSRRARLSSALAPTCHAHLGTLGGRQRPSSVPHLPVPSCLPPSSVAFCIHFQKVLPRMQPGSPEAPLCHTGEHAGHRVRDSGPNPGSSPVSVEPRASSLGPGFLVRTVGARTLAPWGS